METIFVTMAGDQKGETALKILRQKKHPTITIENGQTAPLGSITLFTPTGPIEPEIVRVIKPEFKTKRNRDHRSVYLCCSAVRLKKVVPPWAQTTPFHVGVVSTENRRPQSGGTFAASLWTMQKMFADWDWTSESLVPWAQTDKDPSLKVLPQTIAQIRNWRNREDARQLSQKGDKDLDLCRQIQKRLEKGGGYFVKEESQALQISPDHFLINQEQLEVVEKNSASIRSFWKEALKLYLRSTEKGSDLGWVAQSIEGPITQEQREWQRIIAQTQREVLPLFARADLSSLLSEEAKKSWGLEWFLVEIQERIGGLGLVESWTEAITSADGSLEGVIGNRQGLASSFAAVVKKVTRRENPIVVLICPEGYEVEQRFLAKMLRSHGVQAHVVNKNRMEESLQVKNNQLYVIVQVGSKYTGGIPIFNEPEGVFKVDFLYRREINGASMALTEIGQKIMKVALNGSLIVEPPLNMIYDCKSPMAWVHHPELKSCFSADVRSLIPPTALLPRGKDKTFLLAGEKLTLRKITDRSYVVKYAGENINYGFGGRAVYQTDEESIAYALGQVKEGHPWIIQPRDRTTYSVREWIRGTEIVRTRHGAGRLMFHYAWDPKSGQPHLMLACAQIRPDHWKAAGNRESIYQEIRLKKEEADE